LGSKSFPANVFDPKSCNAKASSASRQRQTTTMAAKLLRSSALGVLLGAGYIDSLQVPRRIGVPYFSSVATLAKKSPRADFSLASASDDFVNADAKDDFEDFLNELTEDVIDQVSTTSNSDAINKNKTPPDNVPSHFIQRQQAVGIGGSSGFTYDVNALKRNLVQESVKGCKQELLALLGDGREYSNTQAKAQRAMSIPSSRRERDDLIEERLAALVQVGTFSVVYKAAHYIYLIGLICLFIIRQIQYQQLLILIYSMVTGCLHSLAEMRPGFSTPLAFY
jgi:hypothetical protein